MWDTAFHAIHDAWTRDPLIAFGDLLNHTILQSKKGCIQDAAGEYYADTGGGRWVHPENYDNFPPPCTGPPVTGIALWDVYQKTGSLGLLKRMYPHLVLYERWIIDAKASGLDPDLISYKNWFDCGWDDSKRWGKGGMKDVPDAKVDWDFPVVPVDGNVFLSILRETLSKTAALLGDEKLSREFAEKAERTRRAIDRLELKPCLPKEWGEASVPVVETTGHQTHEVGLRRLEVNLTTRPSEHWSPPPSGPPQPLPLRCRRRSRSRVFLGRAFRRAQSLWPTRPPAGSPGTAR
jgi:hypothetical protein